MKDGQAGKGTDYHRNGKRQETEGDSFQLVLLKVVHIQFQSGQKDNIVHADLPEQLKTIIKFQKIQAMLSNQHTGKYHSHDMRDM